MGYTTRIQVNEPFETVVETTIEKLGEAGFGVLCDIDVRATLREKLNEDFRSYRILGACNPELAHKAMTEELELGALLPCNVIVYETNEGIVVSAVSPPALLSVVDNDDLDPVADDVNERLTHVLEEIQATLS